MSFFQCEIVAVFLHLIYDRVMDGLSELFLLAVTLSLAISVGMIISVGMTISVGMISLH